MTTANCPGNEELDFRLIFGEEGQQQPLGPADLEPDDNTSFYILNVGQPQSVVTNHQSIGLPRHGNVSHSPVINTAPRLQTQKPGSEPPSYEAQDSKYGTSPLLPSAPVEAPKAFECPSIQITSISPSCPQEMDASEDDLRANGPDGDYHSDRPLSRDHLYLPLDHSYRDSSLSPSPCSSLSSRSWFSDASSCESFSHVYDDVDSELNEAAARFTLGSPLTSPGCPSPQTGGGGVMEEQPHWQHHHPAFVQHSHSISLSPRQSPCHSPRTSVTDENWLSPRPPSRPSSRPTSPCGKRRHSSADICYPGSLSPHHSPTPTPGPSPRGSVTEDTWIISPPVGMSPFQCCPSEADIPSKTRKTSQDRTTMQTGKGDLGLDDQGNMSPNLDSPSDEVLHSLKKDGPAEQFLSVPSHFSWNKPKPGHTPIFRTSSLPPLDWPLPSQFGQYELKIEVQPKAHHRAHYETEGSRGAVKAASGGHPIVKQGEVETGTRRKVKRLLSFQRYCHASRLLRGLVPHSPGSLHLLDDDYLGQAAHMLSKVGTWNFDIFLFDRLTNGNSLVTLMCHLFNVYDLIHHFQLDMVKLNRFLGMVQEDYHSQNPYHNAVHAADVTQAMYCYLKEPKLAEHLSPLDIFLGLMAAAAHDVDHPGVNQPFLIKTRHHLASLYQNTSVLESHHWRSTVGMLRESGLLSHLPADMSQDIEQRLGSLILATDINRQNEFLMTFREHLDNQDLDLQLASHRHFILQIALKCADVCNPCRVWELSRQWSERVCEEFYRQGDLERRFDLEISPLCNQQADSIPAIQIGFISYIVEPLFEEWHRFTEPSLLSQTMLDHLHKNKANWGSSRCAHTPSDIQSCSQAEEPEGGVGEGADIS